MDDLRRRKREHMELATTGAAENRRSALWEDVYLVPTSIPEVSIGEVDLTTTFLGHSLAAPIVIAGMTGGHEGARPINANLARAAATLSIAIGTGSQRAAIRDPSLISTYSIIRDQAPNAVVIGNVGMCQLVPQRDEPPFDEDVINAAVAMIDADALAVHLNAVEELIQPEGDRNLNGIAPAIRRVVDWSPVPVIAKETGAGMTRETAHRLLATGVSALDVGGVGGTSFARIEGSRAEAAGDVRGTRLGSTFGDWGLPTSLSVMESVTSELPVIATGGIRNGLHGAKAIALGAAMIGIGGPAIRAARQGADAVVSELSMIIEELRVAMTLIGAKNLDDLRHHRPILRAQAAEWARARKLESYGAPGS